MSRKINKIQFQSTMYWISSAILSFYLFLQCHSYRHVVYKKIEVKQGVIRGEVYETENGLQAEAYRGIPYAEPPVGRLRWKARCSLRYLKFSQNLTKAFGKSSNKL